MQKSAKKSTKRRRTEVKKLSASVKEVTKKQAKKMKGGLLVVIAQTPQVTATVGQVTFNPAQVTATVAGIGAPKIK
jgi:hypothetical protein